MASNNKGWPVNCITTGVLTLTESPALTLFQAEKTNLLTVISILILDMANNLAIYAKFYGLLGRNDSDLRWGMYSNVTSAYVF